MTLCHLSLLSNSQCTERCYYLAYSFVEWNIINSLASCGYPPRHHLHSHLKGVVSGSLSDNLDTTKRENHAFMWVKDSALNNWPCVKEARWICHKEKYLIGHPQQTTKLWKISIIHHLESYVRSVTLCTSFLSLICHPILLIYFSALIFSLFYCLVQGDFEEISLAISIQQFELLSDSRCCF